LLKVAIPVKEGTLRVQATKPRARFDVTADGEGLVGHAGMALLVELADRLGLPAALDRWTGREQPGRARHRRRPDILATGDHRWAAGPRPGRSVWWRSASHNGSAVTTPAPRPCRRR
jgi:hypothetical protein